MPPAEFIELDIKPYALAEIEKMQSGQGGRGKLRRSIRWLTGPFLVTEGNHADRVIVLEWI